MSMIYFNNGATSYPKAPGVAEAVSDALAALPGAANRGGIEDFDVLGAVRDELATLMGVSHPEQIGLGANATWGLNCAIGGLVQRQSCGRDAVHEPGCGVELGSGDVPGRGHWLGAGDTVLTTAAEHNSVLRPLYALEQRSGLTVEYLPVDEGGRVCLADWQAALRQHRPKLAVVTHASNVTGAVNDIGSLAQVAHEFGTLVLVDLAQSLGCIDVALEQWEVDLAAFTGHKYLLGPQGTGGLYVRPGLDLDPYLTGGTGIHSDLDTMPPTMPLHIEAGTNNEPGFYGLLAALKWRRSVDGAAAASIEAATSDNTPALLRTLKDGLLALGARVIDPGEPCSPVVSFTLEGFTPAYLGETLLDSYDIIVRTGLHCAPRIFSYLDVDPLQGTVRVSLSRFNKQAEIDEFLEALREIKVAG